ELLQAESSCFLFWGEMWLDQLRDRLFYIETLLNSLETPPQAAVKVELTTSPSSESVQSSPESTEEVAELPEKHEDDTPELVIPNPVELAKKPIMRTTPPQTLETPETPEPPQTLDVVETSVTTLANESSRHPIDRQTRQAILAKKRGSKRSKK
ncbi:MAG: hypothetical protein R3E08_14980, partial [Thiotrichaceae bacterium]